MEETCFNFLESEDMNNISLNILQKNCKNYFLSNATILTSNRVLENGLFYTIFEFQKPIKTFAVKTMLPKNSKMKQYIECVLLLLISFLSCPFTCCQKTDIVKLTRVYQTEIHETAIKVAWNVTSFKSSQVNDLINPYLIPIK
ncbi:hypothetical protein BpHYR1_038398 [Brachionus plicatilis]|uniref:Uncharacterized protein n=1 Tax=Brachionus plicatilis TaxID=10195 RepID=A0A3M7S365_BRAPC|nr:hypothetical protein BpHYR1_038398 [Brachionus plicatilis]